VTITAAVTIDEVTVDAGGILTQQQNVTVNNGPGEDISVNGIYNLDNNASVTGSGSLLINAVINFNSGDIQTRVAVAPAATMNITTVAAKTLRSEILNNGTINWVKGNISFQAGTLTNNGNFNISNANSLLNTSGTNGFINKPTGITTKVSGGANALEIPAANEGIIRGTGTLSFGTCNNIGIIAPGTSPGTITYNSDNDLFTPFSELRIEINDLSGPGVGHDQLRRAGNIVLNGKLTVTETGSAPTGSYEIMRSTSGTITGNFATLQLPPGYSLRIQNNSRLWLDKVSTLRTASGSDMTVKQAIVNDKIIFPNPADRYVSIRMMDQLAKGSITIQMADNTGKVIKQWSALYMGKNSIITLNTGNFANGLYMLLITDSTGKMLCGKVMVRH
jgi:hypothetical protein